MVDVAVAVQPDHIKKLIRPSMLAKAVCELVWNSLDADAKNISVCFSKNALGGIEGVVVADDGTGIRRSACTTAFGRLGGSWKATAGYSERDHRPLHGANGEGRFRAYALGVQVEWSTVADDLDGRWRTRITGQKQAPEVFHIDDGRAVSEPTGTVVTVTGVETPLTVLVTPRTRAVILAEFVRHLMRYPDISIVLDERRLQVEEAVVKRSELTFSDPAGRGASIPLEIIEWKEAFARELVLCDERGFALIEFPAAVQASNFYFSAYVSWPGFDRGEVALADMGHERYGPVVTAARRELRTFFDTRSKERIRQIVDEWKREDVYPFQDRPRDAVERTKRDLFDVVAVQALPGIARDRRAKRLSLRLIKEALEHSPSTLHRVLEDVLDLGDDELNDLARLLDRTSLGSVISAAQTVSDRLDFLRSLELLLFDPGLKKTVLERSQLHRILAAEPWVFGEGFALSVDDQGLKEVLRRHLEHLGRSTLNLADVPVAERTTAIVDLMLSKTVQNSERQHHLVVELKRPAVTVGYRERHQIESYAMAVAGDPRFRDAETTWDFVLVANDLSDDMKRLTRKKGQPRGLIHTDDEMDLRIWIQGWGSIIEARRRELHFYREKLQVDPTRDDALEFLQKKHSGYIPPSISGREPTLDALGVPLPASPTTHADAASPDRDVSRGSLTGTP
jgi:hypothetical protein